MEIIIETFEVGCEKRHVGIELGKEGSKLIHHLKKKDLG